MNRATDETGNRVEVVTASATLEGELVVAGGARGAVIFAHGSGSSRRSPRNQFVARELRRGGLATLLFDLLTPEEGREDERTGHLRFNIELLADRLAGATDWLRLHPSASHLSFGYFGASTGASAALVAAAYRPKEVSAVVSRGGRPDLAGRFLQQVEAPTLLIVGGDDTPVIAMNREALAQMHCETRLEIIPAATHLFEEPGALEAVAQLARDWFRRHLGGR
ncbi:MAG: dienelactone hydrolase family protein [Chloroflexi bacterium]|nr:dienelactone hydrolase family protein [Chloroflexota bacterium]